MGQIYFADTAILPPVMVPDSASVELPFIATLATMLLQTGAAGFLIGDVICLAPIPGKCTLLGYEVRIPEMDTGSAVTFDLGDNQILSGAINGTVGTAFTTPALGYELHPDGSGIDREFHGDEWAPDGERHLDRIRLAFGKHFRNVLLKRRWSGDPERLTDSAGGKHGRVPGGGRGSGW